jgi:membrane protein DedA with SNARE-associated domain
MVFGLVHIHLHIHHFHPDLDVHVHLTHHPLKGPPFDYVGLAAAAAASWIGLPGPGEPVLIAAGILAAEHKLDILSVLLVTFAAANAGGIAGWLVGLKAGRALLTARGPLHSFRLRALEWGDEVFKRYVAIAVFLAPSFAAGIHGVRPRVYLFWNMFWALVWTLGLGLGGYYAGPPIVETVSDLGWVSIGGLIGLVALGVWLGLRRRRRRATQALPGAGSS